MHRKHRAFGCAGRRHATVLATPNILQLDLINIVTCQKAALLISVGEAAAGSRCKVNSFDYSKGEVRKRVRMNTTTTP